jgi:tetratricopeptide (TPR) repeat protein
MGGRDEDRDAVQRRVRPEVALQPPPRPSAVPSLDRPILTLPAARSRSLAPAVALLAFLVAAAVGLFVALPRWMARRPAADAGLAKPAVTATPSVAAPVVPPATSPVAPAERPVPATPRHVSEPPAGRTASAPSPAADPAAAEWARAMSEGLAALDRGALDEAQTAFARAEAARPGASATADARKRVDEARNAEGLAAHRSRAEAAEAREDWKGAIAEYEAALKLDPRVAFALAGRARSLPRVELDEKLESYLRRPERLSADAVGREAERVLAQVEAVEPAGPRLQQQRAALERLLGAARTPVAVPLRSDGATEVVVLRVGTIGTFREKDVPLRPGSYVVLGRRRGYRDTRKTLVVSPGHRPAPLDVRCEEAL